MARRFSSPCLVGKNYSLLWLQRVENSSRVRYYLSFDKSGAKSVSGYVFSVVEPVKEYQALLRLQKKIGKVIRPCVVHLLNGDVEE